MKKLAVIKLVIFRKDIKHIKADEADVQELLKDEEDEYEK